MNIVLASKSPRRIELLKLMGLQFIIEPCTDEERVDNSLPVHRVVEALALQKASAIAKNHPDSCIIGADTIVWLDNQIIGKPKNEQDAFRILNLLQNRTHEVYTGIAVITPSGTQLCHCITKVTFAPMSHDEINGYIASGEPMDKAGAYGMQGVGGVFIKKVEGSSFNVIGMPIDVLYRMLKSAKVI